MLQVTEIIGHMLLEFMDRAAAGGLLGLNHSWVRSMNPTGPVSILSCACALVCVQGESSDVQVCVHCMT